MFTKKNYLLFILLLVLAAGTYAYTVPYQKWRAQQSQADSVNFLSLVDMSAVSKIAVEQPDEQKTYTITKDNGAWLVQPGNWPTEQVLMDALESKMAAIISADFEIASINQDKQSSFGITDTAARVKLYQGDAVAASFIIGNIASDYQSSYIGREGDPNTYRIPETLIRAFDTASWQDRTITNLNTASIDTIILSYPGQPSVELTSKPAASGEIYWRLEQPRLLRLNKEKIEDFLDQAGKLEAVGIPEQTDVAPQLTLELKGTGVSEKLILGSLGADGNYLLRHDTSGRVYLINKDSRNALVKQVRDFQ